MACGCGSRAPSSPSYHPLSWGGGPADVLFKGGTSTIDVRQTSVFGEIWASHGDGTSESAGCQNVMGPCRRIAPETERVASKVYESPGGVWMVSVHSVDFARAVWRDSGLSESAPTSRRRSHLIIGHHTSKRWHSERRYASLRWLCKVMMGPAGIDHK